MIEREPKIYLLPNLMTAGNLFCGFAAILAIVEGISEPGADAPYYRAIWFILGACVFDLLDGRMARLAGAESPFGREFDSITDVVSFGVAPALLIFHLVLQDIPDQYGKIIAFVYLLCGAMRLARFNCEAAMPGAKASSDFRGLPIPAAAGVIVSITLALLHYVGEGKVLAGGWKHVLWVLMILVSYLMFSNITFPSFKGLNFRTRRSLPWVFAAVIVIVFTVKNPHFMPAVLFVSYMLYGFVRPWVSRRWRRQIEIEMETEPDGDVADDEEVGMEDADEGEDVSRERPA